MRREEIYSMMTFIASPIFNSYPIALFLKKIFTEKGIIVLQLTHHLTSPNHPPNQTRKSHVPSLTPHPQPNKKHKRYTLRHCTSPPSPLLLIPSTKPNLNRCTYNIKKKIIPFFIRWYLLRNWVNISFLTEQTSLAHLKYGIHRTFKDNEQDSFWQLSDRIDQPSTSKVVKSMQTIIRLTRS